MVQQTPGSRMRQGRFRPPAAALALLSLASILSPLVSAQPTAGEAVDVGIRASFSDAASGELSLSVGFHRAIVNGETLGAGDLRELLRGPRGEEVERELLGRAAEMLGSALSTIFPRDAVGATEPTLDERSLGEPPGGGEEPPVVALAGGRVSILPVSHGLPRETNLSHLLPLLLADGVGVRRELILEAPAGWRLILELESFPGSVFEESGGPSLLVELNNTDGIGPISRAVRTTLRSSGPSAPGGEELFVSGEVSAPSLTSLEVEGRVELRRADPRMWWEAPEGILNLTTLSGEALSELARAGALPLYEVYNHSVRPVQSRIQERALEALRVPIELHPYWELGGNLSCRLIGQSSGHPLMGLDPELVTGALRAGAELSVSLFIAAGWPTELEILPPAGVALKGLERLGTIDGRGRYVWRDPTGQGELRASLTADPPPPPARESIDFSLVADFGSPALELGRILRGGSVDVAVNAVVRLRMGVLGVPAALAAAIPGNMSIERVTSDLVRLLIAKGAAGEPELEGLLAEAQGRLQGPLRAALGSAARPHARFVPGTLEGYDLSRMDGSRPIELEAWASGSREKRVELFGMVAPGPGGKSQGGGPAPLALLSVSQDFALRGVGGWCVTYRLRFSADVHICGLRQLGTSKASMGAEGDREWVEVSFGPEGGWANITVLVEPRPSFALSQLGPQLCPCGALGLVVALVVAARLRRRGGGAKRPRRNGAPGL
ncbi:MAG: hypothetical protein ACUVV6_02400 [Thermoplasmatota archaeon]